MDTIFATSSGSPPAAIAIIRLSGSEAMSAATRLAGALPVPRLASLRALRRPSDGELLDRALVLVFPAPRTATGEDLVELHVHGGRAVVAAVEDTLAALPGLRRAKAGEFTRRAVTNGIIDLTEAEGLGDLLAAETEGQRRAALNLAEGGLRTRIEGWSGRLVAIAAQVEAELDFSDEADVATANLDTIRSEVAVIRAEIATLLTDPPVERLKDGIRVVLAGPPNSGKSTLLNALVGREAAIVSPVAGTTRDRIEAPVVRDGVAYLMTDTAGLREEPEDPVERIGVARARAAVASADIVLWLGDDESQEAAIRVHSRVDLPERTAIPLCAMPVSAVTGLGLAELWQALSERARALLPALSSLAINRRQRLELGEVVGELSSVDDAPDLVLIAEHLRGALSAFDRVTGRAGIEAVLDTLLSRFCIGK